MKLGNVLVFTIVQGMFKGTYSTYLYTMSIKFDSQSSTCEQVKYAIGNSFLNTTHLTRRGSTFPCLNVPSLPPPLPQQCLNEVYCEIPLHEVHRQRVGPIGSRHYDPHNVPCSAWLDKRCASAEDFLYAHNCTGIEDCQGCCLADPPPQTPPPQTPPPKIPPFIPPLSLRPSLLSPPPPAFSYAPPIMLDTSPDIPAFVFIVSIISIVLGCLLCTGILVTCDCGLNAKFDLMKYIERRIPKRIIIKPIDSTRQKRIPQNETPSGTDFIEENVNDLLTLIPSVPVFPTLPSISITGSRQQDSRSKSPENVPKSRAHIRGRY
tara:strand:- start:10944 stop:11903 length:960 start_codon:yes stop_codon:yes gene_type:complete